jgi:hypothetical protein
MIPASIDSAVLKKLQILNWTLTVVLGAGAWVIASAGTGKAVFVGGIIASSSFGWLQRDLTRLFRGPLTMLKGRFFIKYYARLLSVAVLLFWLISYKQIHALGMLAGLSVVLLSIAVVAIGEAKRLYFPVKEAL